MDTHLPTMSFMARILFELCEARGIGFFVEPNYGYVGRIEFPGGKTSVFSGSSLAINSEGAAKIASDKDYCAYFLRQAGLHAPEGLLLCAPAYIEDIRSKHPEAAPNDQNWDAIGAFAQQHSYPLFLKPNHGASGQDVYRVRTFEDLQTTVSRLFQTHTKLLLQPAIAGRDIRVLMLDGEVVAAYERTPLSISGNGRDTIEARLTLKIEHLRHQGRATGLSPANKAIARHLSEQGLTLQDTLEEGATLTLLPNANLSMGGGVVDLMGTLSPTIAAISAKAAKAVGLRFAGVDLLCEDPSARQPAYTILEVNSAPGLRNYAALGPDARARTLGIYGSILDRLEKLPAS